MTGPVGRYHMRIAQCSSNFKSCDACQCCRWPAATHEGISAVCKCSTVEEVVDFESTRWMDIAKQPPKQHAQHFLPRGTGIALPLGLDGIGVRIVSHEDNRLICTRCYCGRMDPAHAGQLARCIIILVLMFVNLNLRRVIVMRREAVTTLTVHDVVTMPECTMP